MDGLMLYSCAVTDDQDAMAINLTTMLQQYLCLIPHLDAN